MALSLDERAESARAALFERYDELNSLWTQAEEQLTKLHIPQGVEHIYRSWDSDPRDPHNPCEDYYVLGIQKIKGKWRICHGCCYDSMECVVEDWTPITDSSAEIRVLAASHLPGLREAVIKSAEAFIPWVEEAITKLRNELNLCTDNSLKELLAERAKLNGKSK